MVVTDDDLLVLVDRTALDAADAHPADELVVVDGGDEHLQRAVFVALGRIDIVDDRLKQRDKVGALLVGAVGGRALAGRTEDGGGVELLLRGVEVEQQLEHLVHDLVHAGVGPVNLVDDNDDLVAELERLLQHKPRLGHGALSCAVDHLQNALDLAGEIGVARGVDDVDLIIFIVDGRVLGQDRDAALALEIARVHHAVYDGLILPVNAALLQHLVDQRGLAVVDVRDDCNVTNFVLRHNGAPSF